MKKWNFLVWAIVPAMLFSGCHTEEETPLQETIVSYRTLPLPDLIVSIPENYEKTSSKAYEEYYICDDASIIITEDTREKVYTSAKEYSINALTEYRSAVMNLEYVNSETLISGCAYQIQTLEFHYTLGEGEEAAKLTCMAGYMTDGKSMFIITCKSNTETYEQHREEFLSVMHSAEVVR